MGLEKFLARAKSRDNLKALIEGLGEDDHALLVTVNKSGDDHNVEMSYYNLKPWQAEGMLGTVQRDIWDWRSEEDDDA